MSYGKSLIECENHFEFDVNRSLRVGAGFDVLSSLLKNLL